MPTCELVPLLGNHARWFPYHGAYGVTDVLLQGEVRIRLQEDNKPLKCTLIQVRVRCYEAETPSGGIKMKRDKMNVVYESYSDAPVWEKEPNQQFGELAETNHPFRVVIPRNNSGVSTVTYKTFRTWWQIEAILHYPKSSSIHGSRLLLRQQIPLRRFLWNPCPHPPLVWSSSPSPASTPLASTSKLPPTTAATRGIRYSISLLSTHAPGPGDSLDFALRFHRDDPSVTIRKVHFTLDRLLTINPIKASPTNSDDEFDLAPLPEDDDSVWSPPSANAPLPDDLGALTPAPGRPASRGLSSVFKRASSAGTSNGRSPLPSPSYTPSAEVNSYFAALPTPAASTSGSNNSTPTNVGSQGPHRIDRATMHTVEVDHVQWDAENKASLVVPVGKGHHRYSTGESMKTKYLDARFVVGIKIVLRARNGKDEILELDPQVVKVIGGMLDIVPEAKRAAEAEARISERNRQGYAQLPPTVHASHRSPPHVKTSLGARRASNFTLTVNIDQQSTPAPPLPSPSAVNGTNSEGKRRNSWFAGESKSIGIRRRSEQSDGPIGAPVRSRARFGAAPSPPSASSSASGSASSSSQGDTTIPFAGSGYVSSALSRPPLHSEYLPHTPGSPDFLITPTPSTFAAAIAHADQQQEQRRLGTFPLATPPSQLAHHSSSGSSADSGHPRLPRRSGGPSSRSNPYSSANRPRSAGALSTISQRSNLSSQDGSSIRSFSSASSAGFVRESSAPLPSTNTSSHLMMLLGGDDLPSLSLEPKKRRSKPHQQYLSPPADDFTSGVIPVPHPLSPASTSSHSLTASPPHQPFAVPTGLPLGVAVPPSPSLSFNGDDDDISSAASTPPIGSFDAPPSPAIDFQAFSLAARQPSTTTSHSPFASTDAPPHVSSATRAEIAPWSITEEVGPFDISPRKGNGIAKGAKRTTAPSGAWSPPPSASSGMSRTSSSGKLGAAGEYLGVASQEGAPRRKSSGGFGLFGRGDSSHSHEEGHESPGKEGSRWGFLRRGSRA